MYGTLRNCLMFFYVDINPSKVNSPIYYSSIYYALKGHSRYFWFTEK